MIDEYLVRMENHLKDIKVLLKGLTGSGGESVTTLASMGVKPEVDYHAEFNELKELLNSEEWPIAVDPELIVDETSDEDKKSRAEGILDFMIGDSLRGKKFLDFGCGEGYCANTVAGQGARISIGYDVKKQWEDHPFEVGEGKVSLTRDWDRVVENSPYDAILLYDVLDHPVGSPEGILSKVKSVSDANTKIYVRCHPWCSRSATHSYRKLNKAYTHLVFSDIELVRLGVDDGEPTFQILHPHLTYKTWFAEIGLEVEEEHPFTEEVEKFFEDNPSVSSRIKKGWRTSHEPDLASGKDFPRYQISIQFIDYLLQLPR